MFCIINTVKLYRYLSEPLSEHGTRPFNSGDLAQNETHANRGKFLGPAWHFPNGVPSNELRPEKPGGRPPEAKKLSISVTQLNSKLVIYIPIIFKCIYIYKAH